MPSIIVFIITMTSPTITSSTNIFPYSNPIIFIKKMKINFASFKNVCTFAFNYAVA